MSWPMATASRSIPDSVERVQEIVCSRHSELRSPRAGASSLQAVEKSEQPLVSGGDIGKEDSGLSGSRRRRALQREQVLAKSRDRIGGFSRLFRPSRSMRPSSCPSRVRHTASIDHASRGSSVEFGQSPTGAHDDPYRNQGAKRRERLETRLAASSASRTVPKSAHLRDQIGVHAPTTPHPLAPCCTAGGPPPLAPFLLKPSRDADFPHLPSRPPRLHQPLRRRSPPQALEGPGVRRRARGLRADGHGGGSSL